MSGPDEYRLVGPDGQPVDYALVTVKARVPIKRVRGKYPDGSFILDLDTKKLEAFRSSLRMQKEPGGNELYEDATQFCYHADELRLEEKPHG